MNLSQPEELHRFLSKHGIKAEKSLGQHFLCSERVVSAVVERTMLMAGIMEIGPGPGILTSQLAQWDRKLIAIELDKRMIVALAESAPYAEVLHQDALEANFREILERLPPPRAIVGNLPYYITSPLVNQIAEASRFFNLAILMMQREVAERLVAPPGNGDRGSLSVYLQAKFDMSLVTQVSSQEFNPPPKVQSTVIEMVPKESPIEDPEFFRFVRIGFSQPRKTLANNLAVGLKVDRGVVVSGLEQVGLRTDIRPHMMTQSDWQKLQSYL